MTRLTSGTAHATTRSTCTCASTHPITAAHPSTYQASTKGRMRIRRRSLVNGNTRVTARYAGTATQVTSACRRHHTTKPSTTSGVVSVPNVPSAPAAAPEDRQRADAGRHDGLRQGDVGVRRERMGDQVHDTAGERVAELVGVPRPEHVDPGDPAGDQDGEERHAATTDRDGDRLAAPPSQQQPQHDAGEQAARRLLQQQQAGRAGDGRHTRPRHQARAPPPSGRRRAG